MNIAEKILPGYIRRKKTELSVDDFRLFSESADRLVKIILWTVLASACILICRIDIGDTPRFAGKMAGLAAVIPFELWEMVSALRSVRPFLEKSDPSRENWTFAVVLSFLLGVLTCVVSILDVATLLNGNIETKDHEQTFVYEDIKMHVTVPEGYSEIACSESHEVQPRWTRYGILVDDGQVIHPTFSAPEYSGEWYVNAQRNCAVKKTTHYIDKPGRHTLRLICGTPGVVFQKVVIDFGGMKRSYMGPEPTKVVR